MRLLRWIARSPVALAGAPFALVDLAPCPLPLRAGLEPGELP